jgi:hypothetical protein
VVAFRDAAGNPVRVFYALDTKLPLGAELVEAGSHPARADPRHRR